MQRRAQQGYNTQWCFHAFGNTLPAGVHPPESVKSLRETLIAANSPVINDINANSLSANRNPINSSSISDFDNNNSTTSENCLDNALNNTSIDDRGVIQMNAMLHDYIASKGVLLCSSSDCHNHNNLRGGKLCSTTSSGSAHESEFAPVLIYLLDIEGTIVPLPYMRQAMSDITSQYLKSSVQSDYPEETTLREIVNSAANFCPELKSALEEEQNLRVAKSKDAEVMKQEVANAKNDMMSIDATLTNAISNVQREFIKHVCASLESSTKFPHIQQLKSCLWVRNASRAKLTSHLFSDAVTFIKQMGGNTGKKGKVLHSTYEHRETRVAIYSSGQREAQEALLRNTTDGDLTPYIFAHFDLNNAGSKLSAKSYGKIRRQLADQLNLPSDSIQIIFITDSPTEVSAAESSGEIECSLLCVRPGNNWITYDTFLAVSVAHICTFDQIINKCKVVNFDALVGEIYNELAIKT